MAEGEEVEGASAEEAGRRQKLCWKKTQEDPGGAQRAPGTARDEGTTG